MVLYCTCWVSVVGGGFGRSNLIALLLLPRSELLGVSSDPAEPEFTYRCAGSDSE